MDLKGMFNSRQSEFRSVSNSSNPNRDHSSIGSPNNSHILRIAGSGKNLKADGDFLNLQLQSSEQPKIYENGDKQVEFSNSQFVSGVAERKSTFIKDIFSSYNNARERKSQQVVENNYWDNSALMQSSEAIDLSTIQQMPKEEEQTEQDPKEDSFLKMQEELEDEANKQNVIKMKQEQGSPDQFRSSKTFPIKDERRVHFEIDYEDFESEASVTEEEADGSKIIPIMKRRKSKGRVKYKKSSTLPKKSKFSPSQEDDNILTRYKSEGVFLEKAQEKPKEQAKQKFKGLHVVTKSPESLLDPDRSSNLMKTNTFQMNDSSVFQEMESEKDSRIDTPRFHHNSKSSVGRSRFRGTPSDFEINSEIPEILDELVEQAVKRAQKEIKSESGKESQEWPAGFIEVFDQERQQASFERKEYKKPKLLKIEESKDEQRQEEKESEEDDGKDTHVTKGKSENETSGDQFHFSLLKKLPTNSMERQKTEEALGMVIEKALAPHQVQVKQNELPEPQQSPSPAKVEVEEDEKQDLLGVAEKKEIIADITQLKSVNESNIKEEIINFDKHEEETLHPSVIKLKVVESPHESLIDSTSRVKKGKKRERPIDSKKKPKQVACCGKSKCLIF